MKLKPEVLVVLSRLAVTGSATGSEVRIEAQLDRKLYTKVNEVLEACGGKWSRKAKAHLFSGDAAEVLDAVLLSGEVTTARDVGFFPTPEPLARELVAMAKVGPGHHCLEPSAGTGRIATAMRDAGAHLVTVAERDPEMREALLRQYFLVAGGVDDFLDMVPSLSYTRCVMNPPFNKVGRGNGIDHVRHAFSMLGHSGILVSVLPSGVMWREDRRHKDFRLMVSAQGGTLTALPEHSFRESGTDVSTCVLYVERR